MYKHTANGSDQSVWCVASTLTSDLECGHCLGFHPAVDLCRFDVLSLHMEVGSVRQYTHTQGKDRCASVIKAVCSIATTLALTSIQQKPLKLTK